MNASRLVIAALALSLATVAGVASADISKSESYDVSNATSLKILEPAGAHVFVTIGATVKDDTIPAIFSLPDADAYANVKVVMKDGEAWTGKVEIKARRQTVVRFTQTKGAPPPPAANPRYTGRLVNTSDKCDWPENVRFVVTHDGAQVAATQMVFPGRDFPIVLEKGHYAVQILDTSSSLLAAKQFDVGSEGWAFTSGCVK
jgi:hypothetical protein